MNPVQCRRPQLLLTSCQVQNLEVHGQDGSVGVPPKAATNQIRSPNFRLPSCTVTAVISLNVTDNQKATGGVITLFMFAKIIDPSLIFNHVRSMIKLSLLLASLITLWGQFCGQLWYG